MLGAMNLGLDQLGFSWPLTHQYQQPFRVSCQIARAGVAVQQLQVDQDQLRRLKAESSDSAAAATQSSATQVVGIATILVLGSFMNKCKFEEVIAKQSLNLYTLSLLFLLSRYLLPSRNLLKVHQIILLCILFVFFSIFVLLPISICQTLSKINEEASS